jgi:hypothetical protein
LDKIKIGLELECHLIDAEGNISNEADKVLKDPENNGNIIPECAKSMIEIIASPSADLETAVGNFTKETVNAINIAKKHGFRLLPSITLGADAMVEQNSSPRYTSKRKVLGEKKRQIEHHICGTHVHVDILEGEQCIKQYHVMNAMDPVFSLMASSPFFLGINTVNNYRVHLYRNVVFRDFPLQGQLLPYPESIDAALARQEEAYLQWIAAVNGAGFDGEGYTLLNTCWGPLKISERTLEARGSDANILSKVYALAALYKGAVNFIQEEDPKVLIADENAPIRELFKPRNGRILLPHYQTLKKLEHAGIHHALKDTQVRTYLSNIVTLSERSLQPKERHYLMPFKHSLRSATNLSDEIIDYADRRLSQSESIDAKAARELRQHVSDRMTDDIKRNHPTYAKQMN